MSRPSNTSYTERFAFQLYIVELTHTRVVFAQGRIRNVQQRTWHIVGIEPRSLLRLSKNKELLPLDHFFHKCSGKVFAFINNVCFDAVWRNSPSEKNIVGIEPRSLLHLDINKEFFYNSTNFFSDLSRLFLHL